MGSRTENRVNLIGLTLDASANANGSFRVILPPLRQNSKSDLVDATQEMMHFANNDANSDEQARTLLTMRVIVPEPQALSIVALMWLGIRIHGLRRKMIHPALRAAPNKLC